MKKLAILLPALMLPGAASAADMVMSAPAMQPTMNLPAVVDWSGFYAGIQAGYGFGSTGQIQLSPFTFGNLITAFTPAGAPSGSSFNGDGSFSDGFIGGAHIGYDSQAGNLVYGALLDLSYVDLSDEQRAFSRSPAPYIITRDLDFLATLRGRVGYTFGENFLGYVTGGLAYGDVDFSYRQGALSPATTISTSGGQNNNFGYTVGGGVEARLTQNWSFGVEYLYTNLGGNDFAVNLQGGPFGGTGGQPGSNADGTNLTGTDRNFDFHTISAKISYRF